MGELTTSAGSGDPPMPNVNKQFELRRRKGILNTKGIMNIKYDNLIKLPKLLFKNSKIRQVSHIIFKGTALSMSLRSGFKYRM